MANEQQQEMTRLWQASYGRLRAYFMQRAGKAQEVDELVQECFLRAWKSWDQYGGRGSRKSWLFAIARHLLIDRIRRKGLPIQGGTEVIESTAQVPEQDAHRQSIYDLIEREIAALPEILRDVMDLRYAGQLSYAEIAQTLGVPVGTVRSRLHRAITTIRMKVVPTDEC